MKAIRATRVFDGASFLDGGATVIVDDGLVVGVEGFGFRPPDGCAVTEYDATLLPGLIDAHVHLVADSELGALDRVAGYSDSEIDDVISASLRVQLAAGVTTVRDLGDRDYKVVERRDRHGGTTDEPTIVAAGPPLTTSGGHCHYLGGSVSGVDEIARAVDERVARGVDVVKVMASGGVTTPSTDVLLSQFSLDELRAMVERTHAAGLPIVAHAHGTPVVEQVVAAGVDGIEHCSCVTDKGFGQASDELFASIAARGIVVSPTLGVDRSRVGPNAGPMQAVLDKLGLTMGEFLRARLDFVGRQYRAGIRIISGVDAGITPGKRHGALPFAIGQLVDAGVPVAAALASATSDCADACGVGDRKGWLAPGYDADLLVVEGDLSVDVAALLKPQSVYLRGNLVS